MADMRTLDVISIGDANIDLLMQVPRHPDLEHGGEPGSGVRGSEYHLGCGGVAANVASGMAMLGNHAGFIGAIGDDDLGRTFRRNLEARGIDLRYLRVCAELSTSLACIFERSDGETIFYVCPGSRYIPPENLPEEYLASAHLIFLSGHMLTQDEVTGDALVQAVRTARRHGIAVALDPGKYWLNPALESYVRQGIANADILLPNHHEAELLTGCNTPLDAARALLAEGAQVVVVKQGKRGCVACSPDEEIEIPAFATHVRSTLGAGDAFNSGLLHGYLRGWTLASMARFATATAALKILHPGTQGGLPTETEVAAFLERQE